MKQLFTVILLLTLSFPTQAQEKLLDFLPMEDGKVTMSGIVDVENTPKDELYKRAKIWLVDAYRSSKDVLQLEDKENGLLIGKGYFPTVWQANIFWSYKVNLQHTIRLEFKDNKYRYSITDFIMDYTVPADKYSSAKDIREPIEKLAKNNAKKNSLKYFESFSPTIYETVDSLQKAMKSKSKDW